MSPVSGTQSGSAEAAMLSLQASETNLKFLLVSNFERILLNESPVLQEKARQVIPLQRLQGQARTRLSSANKQVTAKEKPLDFQDCLLIELLEWFKISFFKWFDCPSCPVCHNKMVFIGSLPPTEEDLFWGGSRVEGFACRSCNTSERFVRYNHPGKLLETRLGRCGEWANCFSLLCRSVGMDVRYVYDYTDHVWNEIYSQSQGRWLHADCCENKLDSPFLYEHGWGKKLTYVFAFSKDEVVDVTWRYTRNQTEVLKRRDKCQERWLVSTMIAMNRQRQEAFPSPRKSFLEMRLVAEVVELLTSGSRTAKESEMEGRLSGSLGWRLARGETMAGESSAPFTFRLSPKEEERKEFIIKYSSAQDEYMRQNDQEPIPKGWQSGIKAMQNILRKHETDWKMVYLSRTEGSSQAEVSWEIDWSHTQLEVVSAEVVFQHVTFEDGRIDWQVCTGDLCVSGTKDGVMELSGDKLQSGGKKMEISAVLTQGKGSVAWQHTQLFRQPDTCTTFPFYVHLKFE